MEEYPEIKILCLLGDIYGCRQFRILQPMQALAPYNVTYRETAFLPNFPGQNNFKLLVDEIAKQFNITNESAAEELDIVRKKYGKVLGKIKKSLTKIKYFYSLTTGSTQRPWLFISCTSLSSASEKSISASTRCLPT